MKVKKMQKAEFFRDHSLMCFECKPIKSLAIPRLRRSEKSKMAAFSLVMSNVNMLTSNRVV